MSGNKLKNHQAYKEEGKYGLSLRENSMKTDVELPEMLQVADKDNKTDDITDPIGLKVVERLSK